MNPIVQFHPTRFAGLLVLTALFGTGVDAATDAGIVKMQAETPLSIRSAAPAKVSYGKVIELPVTPAGLVQVGNATSMMLRSRHGISTTLRSSGLEPNTVYTMWVVVFNRPQFCTSNPIALCIGGQFGDITIPEVEGSVFWGAGGISDAFGQIELATSVYLDGSTPGLKLFGPGLEDSFRPEVHLVLKRHGDAGELMAIGMLDAALTTPGGCIDACVDVQATSHLPAEAR